jgi:hypothetical protein
MFEITLNTLKVEFANKWQVLLKLIFPSIIVLPLFFSSSNYAVIASFVSFLAVALGIFNSSFNIFREKLSGIMLKLFLLPINKEQIILEKILAYTIFETFQFFPILLIIISFQSEFVLETFSTFLFTALAVNSIGVMTGVTKTSFVEVNMLLIIAIILPVIIFSGIIALPKSDLQILFSKIFPSSYFHQAISLALLKEANFTLTEMRVLPVFPSLFVLIVSLMCSELMVKK